MPLPSAKPRNSDQQRTGKHSIVDDDDSHLPVSPSGDHASRALLHERLAAARAAEYHRSINVGVFVQKEFRPSNGFSTPFGAMAACILGKAEAIGDMLLEVTFCGAYTNQLGHGNQCYRGTGEDLVRDTRLCCSGLELTAPSAAKLCKKSVLKVVWPLERWAVPMWKRCTAQPSSCALGLNAKLGRKVKQCHQHRWRGTSCVRVWQRSVGRAVDGAIHAAKLLFAHARLQEITPDAHRLLHYCHHGTSWSDSRCIHRFFRADNTFGSAAGDSHDQ